MSHNKKKDTTTSSTRQKGWRTILAYFFAACLLFSPVIVVIVGKYGTELYQYLNRDAIKAAKEKKEQEQADELRYRLLYLYNNSLYDASCVEYKYGDSETRASIDAEYNLKKMSPERKKAVEASMKRVAAVWDEKGIQSFLDAYPDEVDIEKYKELVSRYISPDVQNYLFNGSSSGLTVETMNYAQLNQLEEAIILLAPASNLGDGTTSQDRCIEYYSQEGIKRARGIK